MSVAFPALLLLGLLSVAVEGVAYNGKDYTFHSVMINYADAQKYCSSKGFGKLAVVDSKGVDAFLSARKLTQAYWVGAQQVGAISHTTYTCAAKYSYAWSTGLAFCCDPKGTVNYCGKFANRKSAAGPCLAIGGTGWRALNCAKKHRVICEKHIDM